MRLNKNQSMSKPVAYHAPFKRYCEYENTANNSGSCGDHNNEEQIETEVIMFPLPARQDPVRSKTAFASRMTVLTLKNIGDEVEVRPRLGLRNVYSRQNIQMMNKKLKQMKESMFGSIQLSQAFKSPQINQSAQMKLSGSSKIFNTASTNFSSRTKSHRNIYSCTHLRSTCQPSSPQGQLYDRFPKPMTSKTSHSLRRTRKEKIEQNKPTIKPNNFRATLKQKHIDDNPKVLASIIKKKVEGMKTLEVHDYIHGLMKRNSRD